MQKGKAFDSHIFNPDNNSEQIRIRKVFLQSNNGHF